MRANRYSGPIINVAAPEQTAAQRLDLELARWASHQVRRLKTRDIARHSIEQELNGMEEQQRERATHWLNHYRGSK